MHLILAAFASQHEDVFSKKYDIAKHDKPNIKKHKSITIS
jgi:hypothetical protein